MNNKLYVGNLDYALTEQHLNDIFSNYGTVEEVKLIIDRETNRSKGFAFVTMSSEEEAQNAIDELSDADIEGRPVKVALARERVRRNDGNRRYGRDDDRW